ncbi:MULTISPECIES: hypothetical protein [Prauserella salsuginis group]|uniref:Uncharacterized protein n=2 Tax=Prauserella salsuginis group TaxID=2893672 RepID=A0A839XKL6_9PSEU|nr:MULTISPECIES: hypothetical protein [Prauserella salsuginis group]MBB3663820.1 hypothetical protein [Prauserella sediminis]MCR3722398.1 hypothetical protein [Prauserella flava]MCR3736840.1 hypothetical protein [Prauserella salsuginis]
MSVFWGVLAAIGAIIVLVVGAGVTAFVVARMRLRRQLARQQKESAEFPAWARDHGYEYAEEYPESEVERIRGMGALRPFSDFALSRAHHVFYDTESEKARFVFQLTVYSDPHADAPPRGALTVAVAEVPARKPPHAEDIHVRTKNRREPSIHAHGRWVTSYVGGPLTFASMEIVTTGLERHLDTT